MDAGKREPIPETPNFLSARWGAWETEVQDFLRTIWS